MGLFSWFGRRRSSPSPRAEASEAAPEGPVFVSSRGQVFYPQPVTPSAPDAVATEPVVTQQVSEPVVEPVVDAPGTPGAPLISAAALDGPALPDQLVPNQLLPHPPLPDHPLPDAAVLAELEAAAHAGTAPEQRTGEEVAGRVAIGFRDGSTVAVSPDSPQGRALRAVADTLVSGELDEAS